MFKLLSTRYRWSCAHSIYASDSLNSEFRKYCWVNWEDIDRIKVVDEKCEQFGDVEADSFSRIMYRLLKPEGRKFYLFECRRDSGFHDPFTGSYRRVKEAFTWVMGEPDAEIHKEFIVNGKLSKGKIHIVKDDEVIALVRKIVRVKALCKRRQATRHT